MNKGFCAIALMIVVSISCFLTSVEAQWAKFEGNPVLDLGGPGEWDTGGVTTPSVIFRNGIYEMWYTGVTGAMALGGDIGRATSVGGITWLKDEGNPVLTKGDPGEWDELGVWTPKVIFDEGLYKMWYAGLSALGLSSIGYAVSVDGRAWLEFDANPLMAPGEFGEWDGLGIFSPSVIREGDIYKMWYVGVHPTAWQVGYATSPDGVNWTKFEGNPVLEIGETGEWEELGVSMQCVLLDDGTYMMWYTGVGGERQQIGYAFSEDGISWAKDPENPVLRTGEPGSWDERNVSSPSVVLGDSVNFMWYQGSDEGGTSRIGLATSVITPTLVEGTFRGTTPGSFNLYQNRPNPFNPETSIDYSLVRGGDVSLRVYNAGGQLVRILVDEEKPAGNYSVKWNGRDEGDGLAASGVYLYQLKLGGLSSVKRMLLLR